MKYLLIILLIFITNCSLNNNSSYWSEDLIQNKEEKKILDKILNENMDINKMTFDEYKLYLEKINRTKKYPDIN